MSECVKTTAKTLVFGFMCAVWVLYFHHLLANDAHQRDRRVLIHAPGGTFRCDMSTGNTITLTNCFKEVHR